MLEFETQMLLDLMHEDGLLIAARGLAIEQVLADLLFAYSDPGNLVLIIGTNQQEEQFILSLLEEKNTSPIPKQITAECSINERSNLYKEGGCLFVTSRILVVDLLMNRVPSNLITGMVVWRAHRILESCQEAFILRLFRQKNKTGFIKAFSSSPLSFTVGFCHVERVMKNLFVKKLFLWPRFHILISDSLNKCKPEVIEMHIEMTSAMKQIQMSLLDLISSTVQEVKLSNRAIDNDEFCTENAISKSFDTIVRLQLDPIWHQLSTRTKQLIADLKVLRTMLTFLSQYDCVTFFNLVNSLHSTEKAMQSAGWMLLGAAESLFVHAKMRVFGNSNKKQKTSTGEAKISEGDINPEINPKWLALSEVLDEVRKEQKESRKAERCLIVTQDDKMVQQLREYLVDGSKKALLRVFYRTLGPSMGLTSQENLFAPRTTSEPKPYKGKGTKGLKNTKKKEDDDEITMTQIVKKYEFIGCDEISKLSEAKRDSPENTDDNESVKSVNLSDNLLILLQPIKDQNDPFAMFKLLEEVGPKYIVMYDCELSFVRQIELWQARHSEISSRVYFLIYKGTVEEQIYLTSIKKEKSAFEYLIKEKSSMVIPEYADGKSDDHPDLTRDSFEEELTSNDLTRKGGQSAEEEPKVEPKIIVDMREFRSDLPAILHKRGIDIEPATIQVGDYILTPQICVERKSLSDLIGSLNSGRLYNQALSMTRHYAKPILLIEFDHNKPFHLQGRLFVSNDASSSSKDTSAKLQLLTLHFPRLRILWCPSPYATAELFHLLKKGKEEPSVTEAQAITSGSESVYSSEKVNAPISDFLSKLPGVNSKNLFKITRKVKNLTKLLCLSEEELTEIIENSKQAKELHEALHSSMKDVPPELVQKKGGKVKTKFGKNPLRKFR